MRRFVASVASCRSTAALNDPTAVSLMTHHHQQRREKSKRKFVPFVRGEFGAVPEAHLRTGKQAHEYDKLLKQVPWDPTLGARRIADDKQFKQLTAKYRTGGGRPGRNPMSKVFDPLDSETPRVNAILSRKGGTGERPGGVDRKNSVKRLVSSRAPDLDPAVELMMSKTNTQKKKKPTRQATSMRFRGAAQDTMLHPCVLQLPGRRCPSPRTCPFRNTPADLCLSYLRHGYCKRHQEGICPWRHEDQSTYADKTAYRQESSPGASGQHQEEGSSSLSGSGDANAATDSCGIVFPEESLLIGLIDVLNVFWRELVLRRAGGTNEVLSLPLDAVVERLVQSTVEAEAQRLRLLKGFDELEGETKEDPTTGTSDLGFSEEELEELQAKISSQLTNILLPAHRFLLQTNAEDTTLSLCRPLSAALHQLLSDLPVPTEMTSANGGSQPVAPISFLEEDTEPGSIEQRVGVQGPTPPGVRVAELRAIYDDVFEILFVQDGEGKEQPNRVDLMRRKPKHEQNRLAMDRQKFLQTVFSCHPLRDQFPHDLAKFRSAAMFEGSTADAVHYRAELLIMAFNKTLVSLSQEGQGVLLDMSTSVLALQDVVSDVLSRQGRGGGHQVEEIALRKARLDNYWCNAVLSEISNFIPAEGHHHHQTDQQLLDRIGKAQYGVLGALKNIVSALRGAAHDAAIQQQAKNITKGKQQKTEKLHWETLGNRPAMVSPANTASILKVARLRGASQPVNLAYRTMDSMFKGHKILFLRWCTTAQQANFDVLAQRHPRRQSNKVDNGAILEQETQRKELIRSLDLPTDFEFNVDAGSTVAALVNVGFGMSPAVFAEQVRVCIALQRLLLKQQNQKERKGGGNDNDREVTKRIGAVIDTLWSRHRRRKTVDFSLCGLRPMPHEPAFGLRSCNLSALVAALDSPLAAPTRNDVLPVGPTNESYMAVLGAAHTAADVSNLYQSLKRRLATPEHNQPSADKVSRGEFIPAAFVSALSQLDSSEGYLLVREHLDALRGSAISTTDEIAVEVLMYCAWLNAVAKGIGGGERTIPLKRSRGEKDYVRPLALVSKLAANVLQETHKGAHLSTEEGRGLMDQLTVATLALVGGAAADESPGDNSAPQLNVSEGVSRVEQHLAGGQEIFLSLAGNADDQSGEEKRFQLALTAVRACLLQCTPRLFLKLVSAAAPTVDNAICLFTLLCVVGRTSVLPTERKTPGAVGFLTNPAVHARKEGLRCWLAAVAERQRTVEEGAPGRGADVAMIDEQSHCQKRFAAFLHTVCLAEALPNDELRLLQTLLTVPKVESSTKVVSLRPRSDWPSGECPLPRKVLVAVPNAPIGNR